MQCNHCITLRVWLQLFMDIAGDRTPYSVYAAYAHQQPEREFLVYERDDREIFRWTYTGFLDTIHQAANLLCSLGIRPGDIINLHLSNHPAYLQLILAASYLGITVMPSNPLSTADELGYLLDHSDSKIIFTERVCLETVRTVAADRCIVLCETDAQSSSAFPLYEAELAKQSSTPPVGAGAANRVLQLLYTSGTTSRPKGVILTNTNFVFAAEVFCAATGLRQEDRHLIALPLFHAAAQCHALFPSVIAGASIALMSRFHASRFFEQAVEHGGTMAALFGAPLRMLLNQPEHPAERAHALRNVTFAQNLSQSQYEEWHRRFRAPLQQLWGMTETCGLPVMSPLRGERKLNAMGRPVLGYEVKIVNADACEVLAGVQGQLIVRGIPGRSLMLGYFKNLEATAKTLRTLDDSTWLFSGDTVHADDDGFIYFVDRGQDVIKRSGENISSTEVEISILALPGVADVCVVGAPDEMRDEMVVAVIVPKIEGTLSERAVQAHCARRLSAFKVPQRVEFVPSLPRTSVGKIQKNMVRQLLLNRQKDRVLNEIRPDNA